MRVLFIGGTGLISSACTRLAVERGIEVVHLNRGTHPSDEPGVRTLVADVRDEPAASRALGSQAFDAIVDWIAFTPEDVQRDLRLFRDRAGQFVFISSATVYEKPPRELPIHEDAPLGNAGWPYARDKVASERAFRRAFDENGFPVTIVRPSHTYGDVSIPLAVRSLSHPFTSIARMRAGKPLIVPGDGTSLWTLTHTSDFAVGLVGLLGRREAIGEAFNITSDEAPTWDAIYRETAAAAGAEARLVHIPTELVAELVPEGGHRLTADAMFSSTFDTTKLRALVPEFRTSVPFAAGIRRSVAWYDADPGRRQVDPEADARWDHLISAYQDALAVARAGFGGTP